MNILLIMCLGTQSWTHLCPGEVEFFHSTFRQNSNNTFRSFVLTIHLRGKIHLEKTWYPYKRSVYVCACVCIVYIISSSVIVDSLLIINRLELPLLQILQYVPFKSYYYQEQHQENWYFFILYEPLK